MFSFKEKQFIAQEVEKILLSLNHPEMPKEKPKFSLHVDGEETWSFADIKPNWVFGPENTPGVNPMSKPKMDLQEIFSNKLSVMRAEELKRLPIITLGELIAKLEVVPLTYEWYDKTVSDVYVSYDFPEMYPTKLDSWRGIYAELALGYSIEKKKLKDLLVDCKSAVGKTFTGYKGGDFVMGKATPIHVDNYGNSENVAIIDVINKGHIVILTTKYLNE